MENNKYQEALDIINRVAFKQYEDVCYSKTKKSRAMNYEDLLIRSANTLQELVDKETPVKRTITNGRSYCPKCSYSLLIQDVWEMSYCCACGQKNRLER